MQRSRFPRALGVAILATAALAGLLAGCTSSGTAPAPADDPPVPEETVELLDASASSRTSVVLRFSGAVGDAETNAAGYAILAPDGAQLEVLAAYADNDTVHLATEAQQLVTYRVTTPGLEGSAQAASGASFEGSAVAAPVVASAIAIANSQLLVSFADPASGLPIAMGAMADELMFYEIVEPRLEVREAQRTVDGTAVVLTTASQSDSAYTLRVTNLRSAEGGRLLDPQHTTATFYGIARQDRTPPRLTGAVALDATTVLASFSEPLAADAADASRFAIVADDGATLTVRDARLNEFGTQATLSTLTQAPRAGYTLSVSGVADASGNPLDAGASQVAFRGFDDPRRPVLASAIALSNTQLLLTFVDPVTGEGMPMAEVAEIAAFYELSPHLDVIAARLGRDGTTVTLTTSSQEARPYTVKVTNVTSRYGERLIDPAGDSASFQGVPRFDSERPEVVDAYSTGRSSVVVSYSEPVAEVAGDVAAYRLLDADARELTVIDASLNATATQVTLTTLPQFETRYTVTVAGVTDLAGNPLATASAEFDGLIPGSPALLDAIATSDREVLLTFSKRLDPTSATAEGNYDISDPHLDIYSATLSSDGTQVRLATAPQRDIAYTVRAANVRDGAGYALAPERATASFYGQPGDDLTAPRLTGAVASGERTVLVRFSEPMAVEAGDASRYRLTPDTSVGPWLGYGPGTFAAPVVVDADLNAFGTEARLTLAEGTPLLFAPYRVRLDGAADRMGNLLSDAEATLIGVDESAPRLVSALATGASEVLVTFSEPVDDGSLSFSPPGPGALEPDHYELPGLDVLAVQPGTVPSQVRLTTSAQQEIDYQLRVVNVRDLAGHLLDPAASSAGFFGRNGDSTAPDVVRAEAVSSREVLVTFSEAMDASAGDAARYSIPGLTVSAAVLNEAATQARLTTSAQQPIGYTVTVNGVRDAAGNALGDASASFTGIDDVAPTLDRVVVLSSTEVQLTFSEPMARAAAERAANYPITPALRVTGAALSADGLRVTLTTAVQQSRAYLLQVVDLSDEAGNPVRSDSADAGFYGRTPESGSADSDGDGLSDYDETNGVTLASGEVVLLDPNRADTDGDGRSDGDEVTTPCNGGYSHPQWRDSDDDGVADGSECANGSNPADATSTMRSPARGGSVPAALRAPAAPGAEVRA